MSSTGVNVSPLLHNYTTSNVSSMRRSTFAIRRILTSGALQVLRWGALVFGVFYGFSHQNAIRASDRRAEAKHEWDRQSKLITDAKKAYAEKTKPKGQDDGGEYPG
jgi:F-type H+-transporting ATP synthase subunit e